MYTLFIGVSCILRPLFDVLCNSKKRNDISNCSILKSSSICLSSAIVFSTCCAGLKNTSYIFSSPLRILHSMSHTTPLIATPISDDIESGSCAEAECRPVWRYNSQTFPMFESAQRGLFLRYSSNVNPLVYSSSTPKKSKLLCTRRARPCTTRTRFYSALEALVPVVTCPCAAESSQLSIRPLAPA